MNLNTSIANLPAREQQVIELAANGMTDKEMAASLGISAETIATYWRRLLLRYRASSRTEVMARISEERIRNLQMQILELQAQVADKEQAARASVESADLYRSILDALPIGIVFESKTRNVLYCNEAFTSVFEIERGPTELIGDDSRDLALLASKSTRNPRSFLNHMDGGPLHPASSDPLPFPLNSGRCVTVRHVKVGENGRLWQSEEQTI